MHKNISVAVPTRHRPACLDRYTMSFIKTTYYLGDKVPDLHIIYDAPEKESRPSWFYGACPFRETTNFMKSSLTEMYNQAIIAAPTDWVFLCNDDIEFKPGWVEYCEQQIDKGNILMVNLFHYGAMLFHKSLILLAGWFDERFRGGGFEDLSHQLSMSEANLKDMVDRSHDFIRMDGKVEVGHFIDHLKHDNHAKGITVGTNWDGANNGTWFKEKWGRIDEDMRKPSFRQYPEIDFHPTITKKFETKFNQKATFIETSIESIVQKRAIFA